jgi:precorrin-2 dehydrogenase / sirohydrochlorin ferrochelatase
MIPIMLDPTCARVAVCGEGALTLRRLSWLHDCGALPLVYAPNPSEDLKALAGAHLCPRLPTREDVSGLNALWIADFSNHIAGPLTDMARGLNVLVNVEDVLDYCDFHTPAIVHRGRLTFAIGTGGASPAIASIIRKRLEVAFPAAWAYLVAEVAESRLALKAKGATFPDLVADARARLAKAGL